MLPNNKMYADSKHLDLRFEWSSTHIYVAVDAFPPFLSSQKVFLGCLVGLFSLDFSAEKMELYLQMSLY